MKLREYIEKEAARRGESINATVAKLVEKSGVCRATVYNIMRDRKLKKYGKALLLSQATGNKVKVRDIVE